MDRANSVVQDYDNGDDNFKNLFGYLFLKDNLQAVKGLIDALLITARFVAYHHTDVFTKMVSDDITKENPTKMDTKNVVGYL